MPNVIQGPGADLYGLSQDLWKNVPLDRIYGGGDRDVGWGLREDFKNWAGYAAPSSSLGFHFGDNGNVYRCFEVKGSGSTVETIIANEAGWTVPTGFNVYSPTGGSLVLPAGSVVPTSAVTLTPTAASDNASMCLSANQARATAAYAPGAFYPYPVTSGVMGDVIFECRFMLSGLATGFTSFFIGLTNQLAVASAVPAATTSFSTTPGLLGFGCLSGDPAADIGMVWGQGGSQAVQSQYMSAALTPLQLLRMGGVTGITPTTSPATFPNVQVGGAGGVPTMVPATYAGAYMKLGFRYSAASKTLTPYVNGVAQDGKVSADRRVVATGGIQGLTTYGYPGHATLWPNAPMTFGAGLWQTSTTYQTLSIDWWNCVQLSG